MSAQRNISNSIWGLTDPLGSDMSCEGIPNDKDSVRCGFFFFFSAQLSDGVNKATFSLTQNSPESQLEPADALCNMAHSLTQIRKERK